MMQITRSASCSSLQLISILEVEYQHPAVSPRGHRVRWKIFLETLTPKSASCEAGDIWRHLTGVRRHEQNNFPFLWLREDARDVCQDAFVKAWQALPEFENAHSTWIWLDCFQPQPDRAKTRFAKQQRFDRYYDDLPPDRFIARNNQLHQRSD